MYPKHLHRPPGRLCPPASGQSPSPGVLDLRQRLREQTLSNPATLQRLSESASSVLIKLGLIEIVPHNLHVEPRYRLTKAGNNMHEELSRFMLIPR